MRRIPWRLLKPSNLLALVVLVFIAITLIALPLVKLYTYPLISLYQSGRCTITSKQLQTISAGDTAEPTYLAHLEYTVQAASGKQAHGVRYDWFDGAGWLGMPFEEGSTDRAGEQAILDRYAVGKTYQCWYDSRDPSQAVLTRDEDWMRLLSTNFLFAIVALVVAPVILAFVVIVVAGVARLAWVGWLRVTGRPLPAPPVRSWEERRERAAQSLERLQDIWSKRNSQD